MSKTHTIHIPTQTKALEILVSLLLPTLMAALPSETTSAPNTTTTVAPPPPPGPDIQGDFIKIGLAVVALLILCFGVNWFYCDGKGDKEDEKPCCGIFWACCPPEDDDRSASRDTAPLLY